MLLVTCPHCECEVEILATNCCIFRHGVFKNTGMQVSPHAPKIECDRYIDQDQIYGCGRPFQLFYERGDWTARACDYI